jgi:hypothetical protein
MIGLTAVAIFAITQMVLLLGQVKAEASCLETPFGNHSTTTTCVVEVTCEAVGISADRDLSNIIVLYADGTYAKFDDFGDDPMAFDVPQKTDGDGQVIQIVGLWIHAGNNNYDPDPEPAEFNDGESVGRYHVVEPINCQEEEQTIPEDDTPQQVLGQITGLIYHDQNNDGGQGAGEPPLEGWNAWLLTHNGSFVLEDEDTTGPDGLFSFLDLPLGTYYVCQNLQDGWLQTELPAGGAGLNAVPVDTDLGNSPELQALIAQFCYQITLTEEDPSSNLSVFGNFFPTPEQSPRIDETPGGQVLGDSTIKDPAPDKPSGQVLAASTGQVLAATGQAAYLPVLLGAALLIASTLTWALARKKQ